MAEISDFFQLSATSLCQADLFHIDEICCLNRTARGLRKLFPAAIPHPGG
jgi:hypothetical protein